MLPHSQWRTRKTPNADQEKNQGANSAKTWTAPKNPKFTKDKGGRGSRSIGFLVGSIDICTIKSVLKVF
jgi:hypothetical protein